MYVCVCVCVCICIYILLQLSHLYRLQPLPCRDRELWKHNMWCSLLTTSWPHWVVSNLKASLLNEVMAPVNEAMAPVNQVATLTVKYTPIAQGSSGYDHVIHSHHSLITVDNTYCILRHCKTSVVKPPQKRTVTMTIQRVVVKMSCLSWSWVFLMARAKAMAPLSPANISTCWKRKLIFLARPKLRMKEKM